MEKGRIFVPRRSPGRLNKRTGRTSEDFDAVHPMAKLLKEAAALETEMGLEAREQMMERLLYQQKRLMRRRAASARVDRGWSPAWKAAALSGVAVVIVTLLVVVLVLSVGGHKPVTVRQFAKVQGVEGDVLVRDQSGSWRHAREGEALAAGSGIKTGAGSFVSLVFPEGSILRVTDDSEASVKAIGAGSVAVEHLSGSTYHRVHKGSDYVVSKEDISLHALGTAFNVDSRQPENLEIVTVESDVNVAIGEHHPIKVCEGEVMRVDMTGEKKAEKQAVSRERLEEDRLKNSVTRDAQAGYDTGIYEQVDVPLQPAQSAPGPETTSPKPPELAIELLGAAAETGVELSWKVSGSGVYASLVLLRSESKAPEYPGDRIAEYIDKSISRAKDDSVVEGATYQYRLVAADEDDQAVAYGNTLVVSVPKANSKPDQASVSLVVVAPSPPKTVDLEWSVAGASSFDGFVVERTVEKAPAKSATPVGTTTFNQLESSSILYSYQDSDVARGHTYGYRVGLMVNGTAMVYSESVSVEVP